MPQHDLGTITRCQPLGQQWCPCISWNGTWNQPGSGGQFSGAAVEVAPVVLSKLLVISGEKPAS